MNLRKNNSSSQTTETSFLHDIILSNASRELTIYKLTIAWDTRIAKKKKKIRLTKLVPSHRSGAEDLLLKILSTALNPIGIKGITKMKQYISR